MARLILSLKLLNILLFPIVSRLKGDSKNAWLMVIWSQAGGENAAFDVHPHLYPSHLFDYKTLK